MSSDLKVIAVINNAELKDLTAAAEAEGATTQQWEALVTKEQETLSEQNKQITDVVAERKNLSEGKSEVADRKQRALNRKSEIQAEIQKKKDEKAAIGDPVAQYAAFLQERGAFYHSIALRSTVWKKAVGYSAEELRNAPLAEAFAFLESWSSFEESSVDTLKSLKSRGAKFQILGADQHDTTEVQTAFEDLVKLYEEAGSQLLREQARRQDYNESVDKLMQSQSQLLHWCRQQRAALDAQKDAEHIQEFCASLQNNIGVMETNFLVIMEMAEQLVPNPQIEKALIEVAEVWMALEVFAYEKLRSTLVDIHTKSGLESECKLWADFSVKFRDFLITAERLLEMPTDADSKALTKPTLDTCKQLMADHDLHLIISEHVSDFSIREECTKDHYAAIRRTIFSKLTLLTQSFVGQQGYARKQEYTDRLAELSDWIDCKSQNTAWKDLLSRVDKMRLLVEANEGTPTDLSSSMGTRPTDN